LHAPTEEASETEKDAFYQALDNLYNSQCPTQPTVILGNFNAVSGTDSNPYQRVVGPCESGTRNDNSERLKLLL